MELGIDFGTTNSACVGLQDQRAPRKIGDGAGNPFPSLVAIDRISGKVFCGRDVWRQREQLNESCEVIPSIKTHLGTDWESTVGGKHWNAEMVAAEIFLGLKHQAESIVGEKHFREAVVAVPVGFTPEKRAALRRAAALAKIEIKTFVSEPTAAAFNNYHEIQRYHRIGVFDWGGGTLDVALIENKKGRIKELASGDLQLGGDDIDKKLAEWAHEKIATEAGSDTPFEDMSAEARDKLITACEQAKRTLTDENIAVIRTFKYGDLGDVFVTLDIDTFSRIVEPEINRASEFFKTVLRQASTSITELNCILLIGGSVNLRPFAELADSQWRGDIFRPSDSDWSVAGGAAGLNRSEGTYKTAQSVGIIMSDDEFFPLIDEGETVDGGIKEYEFALVEDTNLASLVFADEAKRRLFDMKVPSFGFFKERITIGARIDGDLVLHVTAKSKDRSGEKIIREKKYPGLRLDYQLPVQTDGDNGD